MATHSSVLAWRIPGTGESGGLLSMGSHRVVHDWSDLAVAVVNKNSPNHNKKNLSNTLLVSFQICYKPFGSFNFIKKIYTLDAHYYVYDI